MADRLSRNSVRLPLNTYYVKQIECASDRIVMWISSISNIQNAPIPPQSSRGTDWSPIGPRPSLYTHGGTVRSD